MSYAALFQTSESAITCCICKGMLPNTGSGIKSLLHAVIVGRENNIWILSQSSSKESMYSLTSLKMKCRASGTTASANSLTQRLVIKVWIDATPVEAMAST
ncbi:hypothetical protein XU18_3135 [Perkinsela sp. CCAP 1560/4]|nr:hypothetical protein XU18_3135 [Perkinsela sp. CCAP 1560/4]|eukprot:KNH05973.1 hypothetical protein XU18_3135 [Perkinsela sp. CCAP 1560/4]